MILPINNDIFYVTTGLTYLDGDWTLYAMCRQQILDLSADEEVDISPKEGEHVFISDGFNATVAANSIDASAINSTALDQNLQVIYEDLLKVKEELKDEQPIVIDLNIPMNLAGHVSGEIQMIELDDVKIDRNLFLDDEGKCKQFVNVRLSSGGVIMPYAFLCVFDGDTAGQIYYMGCAIFWQPMIDAIEQSTIIALDFHETHDFENNFVFSLAIRPNLIAGAYYGFVKSAVGFDPEQHTVPAAINKFGEIFVPTYPTLESLNAEHKACEVHIDFIDGVYRSDTTWATIRSYLDVRVSCYLYYNDREYRFVGASPTDMQAHYFVYEGNLVRDCFTINRSDEITREETIITPSSDTYGGIKADGVSSNYTVSVKFNPEDGKLYVPVYPSDFSDYIVTATITGDQGQGFQSDIDYASLLLVRNTVLIVYQETGDVYNPSSADEITGAISATNVKITETGVKISTFTFGSDNSVAYSEKEIPIS